MTAHVFISTGRPLDEAGHKALDRAAQILFEILDGEQQDAPATAGASEDKAHFHGCGERDARVSQATDGAESRESHLARQIDTLAQGMIGRFEIRDGGACENALRIMNEQAENITWLRNELTIAKKEVLEERYVSTPDGMVAKSKVIEDLRLISSGQQFVIHFLGKKLGLED